jgi:hypothetical protein
LLLNKGYMKARVVKKIVDVILYLSYFGVVRLRMQVGFEDFGRIARSGDSLHQMLRRKLLHCLQGAIKTGRSIHQSLHIPLMNRSSSINYDLIQKPASDKFTLNISNQRNKKRNECLPVNTLPLSGQAIFVFNISRCYQTLKLAWIYINHPLHRFIREGVSYVKGIIYYGLGNYTLLKDRVVLPSRHDSPIKGRSRPSFYHFRPMARTDYERDPCGLDSRG